MSKKFVAACIQNNATPDVDFNIETTQRLARDAARDGANLICTPEYFSGLHTENGLFHPAAFREAEHPVLPAFARAARDWKVWFLLGSLAVLNPDGRIFDAVLGALRQDPPVRRGAQYRPADRIGDDCTRRPVGGGADAAGRVGPLHLLRFALRTAIPPARPERRDHAGGSGGVHEGDGRGALARAEPRPGDRT